MELFTGAFTMPLEFEMDGATQTIHPVALRTADGLILVDGGLPGMADAVESEVSEHGFSLADVSLVLATHQDADHVGALSELRERCGAPLLAHEADVPAIVGDAEPVTVRGERPPPVPVAVELRGGETLRTAAGPVDVVHTPGHTPGHLSLYLPDHDLLLAGDALVGAGGDLAGPIPEATPDMESATESLSTLAELDVDRVLCYHGGLVDAGSDSIAAVHAELAAE
jgi:glyoxylase-like metal-dependent hydrolase (beta-lactamase superfamily II)